MLMVDIPNSSEFRYISSFFLHILMHEYICTVNDSITYTKLLDFRGLSSRLLGTETLLND